MFFPRLRRRAKWVFVTLAVVFAGGFLVYGVGTGVSGSSLGDILQDIFSGGGSDQPEIDEALEKLEDDPSDADALLELANAYQADQRFDEAIGALVRYTELRPQDADGLKRLASLYQREANDARRRVAIVQESAISVSPGQALGLDLASPVGPALQNPIEQALANAASERVGRAVEAMQAAYRRVQSVYEDLVLLEPDEPGNFLQLGQASEFAGDTESAVAAYKQFLELSPDDANAPLVQARLDVLEGTDGEEPAGAAETGTGAETGAAETG
jgi:tetratricopeptide (TPR) repeat protein